MPYRSNAELPPAVKDALPAAAQSIFRNAFNSAVDRGMAEERAFKIAWGAVENAGYHKTADGKWIKASKAPLDLTFASCTFPGVLAARLDADGHVETWNDITRTSVSYASDGSVVDEWQWHHPEFGAFALSRDDLDAMARNVVAMGQPINVDYWHFSQRGGTPEQMKNAGQLTPKAENFRIVEWQDPFTGETDGTLVLQAKIDWTPQAKAYIESKEYTGLSAAWSWHYPNPFTGEDQGPTLSSIGLLNQPFIPGLRQVAASKTKGPEEEDMEKLKEILAACRTALGVEKDEEIAGAIEKLSTDRNEVEPVQKVLAEKFGGDWAKLIEAATKPEPEPVKGDVVTLSRADWDKTQKALKDAEETRVLAQRLAEEALEAKFDREFTMLVQTSRCDPKHRDFALEMFRGGEKKWDAWTATLPEPKAAMKLMRGIPHREEGGGSAVEEVETLAASKVEADPKLTLARARLIVTQEDPELYRRYLEEMTQTAAK